MISVFGATPTEKPWGDDLDFANFDAPPYSATTEYVPSLSEVPFFGEQEALPFKRVALHTVVDPALTEIFPVGIAPLVDLTLAEKTTDCSLP